MFKGFFVKYDQYFCNYIKMFYCFSEDLKAGTA